LKALFICSSSFDYAQDLLYSGLLTRLGRSSVCDYPWNPKYHVPFWEYPKGLGYSGLDFPRTKPRKLDVDFVILGSAKADAVFRYHSIFRSIPKSAITVFLDGGDHPAVAGDLDASSLSLFHDIDRIRPFDYILKREYLTGLRYEDRVKPFPFSFASQWISRVQCTQKLFDVTFWAVEGAPVRSLALELLKGKFDCDLNGTIPGNTLQGYSRKGLAYLTALASSRVTLSLRGVGWDTLRFWEATALGVPTISQLPRIVIPEPFESDKNILYVEDTLESLLDKCAELLSDERRRCKMGYAARFHAYKFHSNLARADRLLGYLVGSKKYIITQGLISNVGSGASAGPRRSSNSDPIRIAVILFGLMGDVLMRTEALSEIRLRYVNASIDCFVDPIGGEVLKLTTLDVNIIEVSRGRLVHSPRVWFTRIESRLSLYKYVYRRKFDLYFDFYVSPSSIALSYISRAPRVIVGGFDRQTLRVSGVEICANTSSLPSSNRFHMSLPSLSACRMDSGSHAQVALRPFLGVGSRRAPDPSKKDYFLLSLGAGDTAKVPSVQFVSELLKYIIDQTPLRVKIIFNPGSDKAYSDLKCHLLTVEDRVDYLPVMSLGHLKNFFCNAAFFVGPDSGLLHFAYGLRTPTLGIFTFTNPNLVDPRDGLDCCLFVEDTERFQEDPILPKGRRFALSEVSGEVESFLSRLGCSDQTKFRPGVLG